MIEDMTPGPMKPKNPDEITPPEALKAGAALFRDIESQLAKITPDRYTRPDQDVIRGSRTLGNATQKIKQLYTLHQQLLIETAALHSFLQVNGMQGNEGKFQELNRKNLMQRAVHAALGYEVSQEFNSFGDPFGIDINWNIFTKE